MLRISEIYPLFASQRGGHRGEFAGINEKMCIKISF
jgi:hypothetical protein